MEWVEKIMDVLSKRRVTDGRHESDHGCVFVWYFLLEIEKIYSMSLETTEWM